MNGREIMDYEQARACAANISKRGSVLGLESIQNLMRELSDVQERLSIIHIAGTNGKGSTGAFLESILIEAGYRVGRYTSPAVFDPLEVWRINRRNMTETSYARIFSKVKAACDRMVEKGMEHPTIFEVETAMAFCYFYEEQCDYVLLEVGMGGREDATNLITKPVCAVLTSISMDHMQFLGSTIEEITGAKAGIIKEGCPVVTTEQARYKSSVLPVIEAEAAAKHAKMILSVSEGIKVTKADLTQICWEDPDIGEAVIHLSGSYQPENARLAVTVAKKVLQIKTDTIRIGLEKTVWPGRFELLRRNPVFLIDGAHNEDAAVKLEATVENYFTNKKITYIIGVLADKEHGKVLGKMLPHAARVYTVTPRNPRALDAGVLAMEAEHILDEERGDRKMRPEVKACSCICEAVENALENTPEDGVILAFGSLSYLNDVKNCLLDTANREMF